MCEKVVIFKGAAEVMLAEAGRIIGGLAASSLDNTP